MVEVEKGKVRCRVYGLDGRTLEIKRGPRRLAWNRNDVQPEEGHTEAPHQTRIFIGGVNMVGGKER